jgi:hypothetical protein
VSLVEIVKRLGISFYRYLHDRIYADDQKPPLADLVMKYAKYLDLGGSFSSTSNY